MRIWLRDKLLLLRAARMMGGNAKSVLFVTPLLRAREIKMSAALRSIGWKVVLIYLQTTPFRPEDHFDVAIRAEDDATAHAYAKVLWPRICHVFSGAVDELVLRFCRDKPGRVVIDMNDIFAPSLFDYCHERFEPTRECLQQATALCARDLQAKRAERLDGFELPPFVVLFPEYSWRDGPRAPGAAPKLTPDEVHVVSVGTFCLETHGMFDSCYLKLAEILAEQRIHLHIYPHWFYRNDQGSSFNWDLRKDFADFFSLQERTPYVHVHESLPLDELARVLPQYDFGIIAGGNRDFGQRLQMLKEPYMASCYSGRISDYLDARLPVLINPEVEFNSWLLNRYGIGIDLAGALRPGFREQLLTLKHDPKLAAAAEKAARQLSLSANVGRLAEFYERVIAETRQIQWSSGIRLRAAARIPLLGRPLRSMEAAVRQLNQSEEERIRNQLRLKKLHLRYDTLRLHAAQQNRLLERFTDRSVGNSPDGSKFSDVALRLQAERGMQWADEISGLLNWPEIREVAEQRNGMPELLEMMRLFVKGTGPLNRASWCWDVLAFKNFNQLLRDGYRSFKRTIACNYFNFLVQAGDSQIGFLESHLTPEQQAQCQELARNLPDDPGFEWHDQRAYRYFVLLLWTYAKRFDTEHYLDRLQEPLEGNPVTVPHEGALASQDLANSLLEYYSIREHVDFARCDRVLEIGGGYGRDAYVVMMLNPHIQYFLVDIPPAIWIAQRYLSSVFPDRKVFPVREFHSYQDVRKEMEQSSIVCLLPHQLELIPDAHFDLALNISSFGEMRQEQIDAYMQMLERLTRGYFYMKQWKVSRNAFDRTQLTEKDYSVSARWSVLYSRPCAVQTDFFEALYITERIRRGTALQSTQ